MLLWFLYGPYHLMSLYLLYFSVSYGHYTWHICKKNEILSWLLIVNVMIKNETFKNNQISGQNIWDFIWITKMVLLRSFISNLKQLKRFMQFQCFIISFDTSVHVLAVMNCQHHDENYVYIWEDGMCFKRELPDDDLWH